MGRGRGSVKRGGTACGQTGASQRRQVGFQRSRPPDTAAAPSGRHPPGARASRSHPLPLPAAQFPSDIAPGHPAGGNRMGPAEAEPWRRCRSIRVEEMGEAVPGFVRAGRPRSRGASSHDIVTPRAQIRRSIRAPLVIEGGPSVFGPMGATGQPQGMSLLGGGGERGMALPVKARPLDSSASLH